MLSGIRQRRQARSGTPVELMSREPKTHIANKISKEPTDLEPESNEY
jgi:hypothetical protein